MCPPRAPKAGDTHSPGGEGGGGSIFWKTPDIGLASYSIISLRSILLQARRASCAPPDTTAIARTLTARSASSATATGTPTPATPAPAPAATTCRSSHLFQLPFTCLTPSATSTRRSVSRTPRLLTAGTNLSKMYF